MLFSQLFPVEEHHLYKGHGAFESVARETTPVPVLASLSQRAAALTDRHSSKNRFYVAHFLAVAVLYSHRSASFLRIQDEHGVYSDGETICRGRGYGKNCWGERLGSRVGKSMSGVTP